MPAEHKKVIAAIRHCRTEAHGTPLYYCERCGQLHTIHRCCGNRPCPGCQHHKAPQWLEKHMERQLPGHPFMLTFTVPEPIRPFMRSHQRIAYIPLQPTPGSAAVFIKHGWPARLSFIRYVCYRLGELH